MNHKLITHAKQDIDKLDIEAVVKVLGSDFLTQGPTVPAFESAISAICKSKYVIATNSATNALHIACLALDVGVGDCVWTSPNTFVASANCILYCGATVDFVDIDPKTFNMSIEALSLKLASAERDGCLPKVLIPVHFAGQSCDMKAINQLASRYGFKVIEDASHAIGGKYLNRPIGECIYSDICIFSFHPVKIITTAEGGAAATNSDAIAKKLRLLRSHGITSTPNEMISRPENEIWNYQQVGLGFNYRMSELHAALGLSQLSRLDKFVSRRHEIAKFYDAAFEDLPLATPYQHPDCFSSFHLYPIQLELNKIKKTQRQIYEELIQNGIIINLHYIPVYLQPYFENIGFKRGYCPVAENYFIRTLSIPMHTLLSNQDLYKVVNTMRRVLS